MEILSQTSIAIDNSSILGFNFAIGFTGSGDLAVTWEQDDGGTRPTIFPFIDSGTLPTTDIVASIYSPVLSRLTAPQLVHSVTEGDQLAPAVLPAEQGYSIAWHDVLSYGVFDSPGPGDSDFALARIGIANFDEAGARQSESLSEQQTEFWRIPGTIVQSGDARIAMFETREGTVDSISLNAEGGDVRSTVFAAGEFELNSTAAARSGGFVAFGKSTDFTTQPFTETTTLQLLDAFGQPVGAVLDSNQSGAEPPFTKRIAPLENGGFALAGVNRDPETLEQESVYVRRYDPSGNESEDPITIDGSWGSVAIADTGESGLLIALSGALDPASGRNLFVFLLRDENLSAPVEIDSGPSGTQDLTIAYGPDHLAVIGWRAGEEGINLVALSTAEAGAEPITVAINGDPAAGSAADEVVTGTADAGETFEINLPRAEAAINIADNETLVIGDGIDRLNDIERIRFADSVVALDIDGAAGEVYRLYQAAFAREPDVEGIGFWLGRVENADVALSTVAQRFTESSEFVELYGALNSRGFVEQLYRNILGREGDSEGVEFWLGRIEEGGRTRGDILAAFADSPENIALVAPAISGGIVIEEF